VVTWFGLSVFCVTVRRGFWIQFTSVETLTVAGIFPLAKVGEVTETAVNFDVVVFAFLEFLVWASALCNRSTLQCQMLGSYIISHAGLAYWLASQTQSMCLRIGDRRCNKWVDKNLGIWCSLVWCSVIGCMVPYVLKECVTMFLFNCLALEGEGTMILQHTKNHSPSGTVKHPGRTESSATWLCEPQISHDKNLMGCMSHENVTLN